MPYRSHHMIALSLALAVGAAGFFGPVRTAYAASYEELQQQVEESTATYEQAMDHLAEIQGQIDQNEQEIAEMEAKLPEQRQEAAGSLRTLYKMQQSSSGLIELVLTSDDFNELIATLTYLDRIQSQNMTELLRLADLNAQLEEAHDRLSAQEAQARQEADAALQAQKEALAAREEVRLAALAQAEAERAEAERAIAEAAKQAEEGQTFTNASGQETSVSAPTSDTPAAESVVADEKDSSEEGTDAGQAAPEAPVVSERDAFVAKWAPRIDAYLAGSPLGGHGKTFAEAAWDYNVDPRWSPAISCIESSKGAVCFRPYNAWGWGNSSWGDWDSAIRSHVAGLSAGYGYTISTAAAQKYCPPTWQAWYSSVLAQMNSI